MKISTHCNYSHSSKQFHLCDISSPLFENPIIIIKTSSLCFIYNTRSITMAEKDNNSTSPKSPSKNISLRKRLYNEIDSSDDEHFPTKPLLCSGEASISILSGSKKFIHNSSYRDVDNESQETQVFKNSNNSSSIFSDSIDSGNWNLSSSQLSSPTAAYTSLPSLELNSIIQQCDGATLNSLTMSQMSCFSDNAMSSPFHESVDLESPSTSRCNSLPWNSVVEKNENSGVTKSLNISLTSSVSSTEIASEGNTEETASPVTHTMSSFTDIFNLSSSSKEIPSGSSSNNCIGVSSQKCSTSLKYDNTIDCTSDQKPDRHSIHERSLKPSQVRGNDYDCTSAPAADCKKDLAHKGSIQKVHIQSAPIKDGPSSPHEARSTRDSDFNNGLLTYEGNLELKKHDQTCKKNSSHDKFISPNKLKVSDLPRDIQHEDSVTFFQCLSKLVIQISVNHTSCQRSDDDVYSPYIGTDKERNGSGFIVSTDVHMTEMTCSRPNCLHCVQESSQPKVIKDMRNVNKMSNKGKVSSQKSYKSTQSKKSVFGGIRIRTNRHVIFDKSEADCASVNFFFQSSDQRRIVRGHVASILGVNNEQDHIVLHVMSHDPMLLDNVKMHLKNAKSSYEQMIQSTHHTQRHNGLNKMSWVAVISHPHGTASSISFGRLQDEQMDNGMKRVIKYYDAATCPGSSGGLVITPTLLLLQWPGAVHCSYDSRSKHNVSLDSRFQELDATVIAQMTKKYL